MRKPLATEGFPERERATPLEIDLAGILATQTRVALLAISQELGPRWLARETWPGTPDPRSAAEDFPFGPPSGPTAR